MLVYDVECIRPPIFDKKRPNYSYAKGWEDYKGMGIAVVSVYDYETGNTISWFDKDLEKRALKEIFDHADIIVGFNNKRYDNNMLRAIGIKIDDNKCYDILEQMWFAAGLNNIFNPKTHGGYSLDKTIIKNFPNEGKLMSGADAPFLWQDGYYHKVIEYCEHDVQLTKMLLDEIFTTGGLMNPKTGRFIRMALPHGG